MSKRKWFFILGAVALTAALINFLVPKKEKTLVRVVVLSNIIPTLPHWVAVENGYYEKEEIEPKEYSFASSSEPISAMANGDADFLPGGLYVRCNEWGCKTAFAALLDFSQSGFEHTTFRVPAGA